MGQARRPSSSRVGHVHEQARSHASSSRSRRRGDRRCPHVDELPGRTFVGSEPPALLPRGRDGEEVDACLYLIAIDMEMEPLPALETRAGDRPRRLQDDPGHVHDAALVPWLEKTAIGDCDVADEHTSELVEVAPRSSSRPRSSGARRPATRSRPDRSRVTSSRIPTRRQPSDTRASSRCIMDYDMLATTKDELADRHTGRWAR